MRKVSFVIVLSLALYSASWAQSIKAPPAPVAPSKSANVTPRAKQEGELALRERWYPIQVKQKDKAGRPDIDSFQAVMMREEVEKGFFVSFAYTSDALTEADAFFRRTGKSIIPLTVRDILDEQIARKLC